MCFRVMSKSREYLDKVQFLPFQYVAPCMKRVHKKVVEMSTGFFILDICDRLDDNIGNFQIGYIKILEWNNKYEQIRGEFQH